MKKRILACMLSLVVAGSMIGCSSKDEETSKDQIRVGMVTDAGDIDDKSFNQGTWEGVKKAEEELGVEINYLKPAGETEAEYNIEIGNLYDAGYNLVICPGFKFETSIYSMQEKYQDAKFVIIDGAPSDGENVKVGAPYVQGAKVQVVVEDSFKDKKVLVFKYKSKKDYHRLIGHRQQYTNVRVEEIVG